MAKSQVEAVKASVPQATERLRMLDQSAAEAVAHKVRQVGHFLRVMSDLSCGVPNGRADICAEAFSVVMDIVIIVYALLLLMESARIVVSPVLGTVQAVLLWVFLVEIFVVM